MRTHQPHSPLFDTFAFRWLRVQLMRGWRRAPAWLQFVAAYGCFELAHAWRDFLTTLPAGWQQDVIAHIGSLSGLLVAALFTANGMTAFAMGILSFQLVRTMWHRL